MLVYTPWKVLDFKDKDLLLVYNIRWTKKFQIWIFFPMILIGIVGYCVNKLYNRKVSN